VSCVPLILLCPDVTERPQGSSGYETIHYGSRLPLEERLRLEKDMPKKSASPRKKSAVVSDSDETISVAALLMWQVSPLVLSGVDPFQLNQLATPL